MAKFSADSIKENEAYIGNIKPGESGNVDVNLTGKAVTSDDGKINLTISYEDENGNVTEETKDFILNVTEAAEEETDITEPDIVDSESNHFNIVPFIIAGAVVAAVILIVVLKKRKNKKEQV